MIYRVTGVMQGYGMDADKFYDVGMNIEAESEQEALNEAAERELWYARIEEVKEDE